MKNRIIIYPEYPILKRDYTYTVRISDGQHTEAIPVYSDIRHANHYSAHSMHAERDKRFCSFAFEGEVTVEIKVNQRFESYIIAPSDDPVESTFEDGVIRFTLDRPRQVAIRLDDDVDSYLGIFADGPETDIPDKNAGNVVVFNEANIMSLTGVKCDNACLLVPAAGRGKGECVFFTDFRYIPAVEREAPWIKVAEIKKLDGARCIVIRVEGDVTVNGVQVN